jgi:hypothetical protein
VGETARRVGLDALHEGRVVLGVVEVRGPAVVLGDVGRGGDVGEELVDQLDAARHVGGVEDGAQLLPPPRQLAGVGRGDLVGGPVVVGGQDLVEGVRRRGRPGVDEGGRQLGRGASVRVELH